MIATTVEEISSIRRAYRQLFELGRGGMARVYLAESLASGLRKLVVLKVLNPELCANPEMRAAFRREAELSAQMNHPNVVQVMEVVENAQTPVIVMEYLDGVTLSALLKQAREQMPLALHLYLLAQVLCGLHYFHELQDLDGTPLNAVHRDVSPQNVMVLHDGPVKVLDFGIAKVNASQDQFTRTGLVKGKLHYMPPEQLLAESGVDRRADVFAVGVMLWEAVAGRRMWEGKSEPETLRGIATGTLPQLQQWAPNTPTAILQIVRRATEIDRRDRFATAQEMQLAIENALSELGWFVQQRDLADLMRQQFGELRREQELKLKSALKNPAGPDMLLDCTPAGPFPSGIAPRGDSGNPTAQTAEVAIVPATSTPRRWWLWALAAACCVLLGAGWTLQRERAISSAPLASPPRSIVLEVEASPPGAEIVLDGKPLATDHFKGETSPSDHAVLEVHAPGYLPERKELKLHQDLALQIVLKPSPALASVASAPSEAPPPAPDNSAVAERTTPSTHGTAKSSSRSSKKRAGNCNPPFTFSADGVKTYKPECF